MSQSKTKCELVVELKKKGVTGYSSLNKRQLQNLIAGSTSSRRKNEGSKKYAKVIAIMEDDDGMRYAITRDAEVLSIKKDKVNYIGVGESIEDAIATLAKYLTKKNKKLTFVKNSLNVATPQIIAQLPSALEFDKASEKTENMFNKQFIEDKRKLGTPRQLPPPSRLQTTRV